MTGKAIAIQAKTVKYIGASTDTKPTIAAHSGLPEPTVGSTFYEYDTGILYITYDGTNWSIKDRGQVGGSIVEVRTTKALEAASAYAANDVLSESDTNGEGTDWDFDAIGRTNGAYGLVISAIAISESESVTPRLTLFLFNAPPTSELDDNAANTAPDAADMAKVVGRIDFPAMDSLGTTDSLAVATPNTPASNLPLPFKCASGDDALYGILVTRDAFTQTATDDMTIILLVEQY